MNVVKLKITLLDGRFKYHAEAIEDDGSYYYRVGGTAIKITKKEYDLVVANPHLYYFSTALKLQNVIKKGLCRNVRLPEPLI